MGEYDNNYWVNSYWVVSSLYFMTLSITWRGIFKLNVFKSYYTQKDFKIYDKTILATAYYWGVMAAVRIVLFFRIDLYDLLITSAGKVTIGGYMIIIILFYLTARYHDSKNER